MALTGFEVARLAGALAQAASPRALAGALLVAATGEPGLRHACLYGLDRTGDVLMPLASEPLPTQGLTPISMDALDDPLVYSLMNGRSSFVERMSLLVDAGAGFDSLRERFGSDSSMLVVPQRDGHGRARTALVFAGDGRPLQAWRDDPVWNALVQMHESLSARLQTQIDLAEDARHRRSLPQQQEERRRKGAARLLAEGFIGPSAPARRLREEMLRFADSSLAVLLTGETGTGKDHAALLIHQASPREGKFVPVNCAAIPRELIEAELFGSVRGAYTGATQARAGLVAEADGGTLFLDEIGDMPLALQATLLRLLNEKKYRPVGAARELASDFRLICATHQPLQKLIREGRFREDLYFRIRQQTLHLPPLRERRDDIPALANHVILQHNRERQTHVAGIDAGALAVLTRHPFQGNVRELRNLLLVAAERTAAGMPITARALRQQEPDGAGAAQAAADAGAEAGALHDLLQTNDLPGALQTFERLLISRRLSAFGGSRSRAAQSLGMPKRTLARRCQTWNLNGEECL